MCGFYFAPHATGLSAFDTRPQADTAASPPPPERSDNEVSYANLELTSPYLTAREAADYLKISYSTFRKKAMLIRRCPATLRYTREHLDEYANSIRPRKKR